MHWNEVCPRNLRILRSRSFAPVVLLLIGIPILNAQTCATGEVRVVVIDSQESPVSNAQVSLSSELAASESRSTRTGSVADFPGLSCGAWKLSVEAEVSRSTPDRSKSAAAAKQEVRVVLTPQARNESVNVKETAPGVEQSSSQNYELKPAEVKRLPTNPATVNDTLPLVPGVVRDQTGEIKIDGSGQERSAMVVNQADITDPATGSFGQSIPVDSIESVNLLQTPFLAQYGRFTQSVVAVETKRGGEKWHADMNDPFPDFRIRSFHMRGAFAIPARVSWWVAPFDRGSSFFHHGTSIQLPARFGANSAVPPQRIAPRVWVNSFSQVDWIMTPPAVLHSDHARQARNTRTSLDLDYFSPQPLHSLVTRSTITPAL